MKYLLSFPLLFAFGCFAQQEPLSSFYWNNYSYFNPAMSGVVNKYEANATWRNQWDKVNGAPNTLFVNYGMNLADKHGIGINYVYETIGFWRVNRLKGNYNYQLKLDEKRKLVLGVAVSFTNLGLQPEWVTECVLCDPALPSSYNSQLINTDLGVAYYGEKIIAGVGVTQIRIHPTPENQGFWFYSTSPHLFGNFRYGATIAETSTLIFETQMRTDFVKYSQDLNVGYNWNGILEGRVGYRTSDAVIFNLTGSIAKNYRIGYSYDLTISTLNGISRGTHEITLGWRLPN